MTHKGYTARVEYDERDNIFVGRILGVRAIIGFHGETVAQLRKEFEAAVKGISRRLQRTRRSSREAGVGQGAPSPASRGARSRIGRRSSCREKSQPVGNGSSSGSHAFMMRSS
jgi:predicted RNase H-like HicB family nuclease